MCTNEELRARVDCLEDVVSKHADNSEARHGTVMKMLTDMGNSFKHGQKELKAHTDDEMEVQKLLSKSLHKVGESIDRLGERFDEHEKNHATILKVTQDQLDRHESHLRQQDKESADVRESLRLGNKRFQSIDKNIEQLHEKSVVNAEAIGDIADTQRLIAESMATQTAVMEEIKKNTAPLVPFVQDVEGAAPMVARVKQVGVWVGKAVGIGAAVTAFFYTFYKYVTTGTGTGS